MMRRGVLACVVSHLCEYLNIASVESLPGSREVPGFFMEKYGITIETLTEIKHKYMVAGRRESL